MDFRQVGYGYAAVALVWMSGRTGLNVYQFLTRFNFNVVDAARAAPSDWLFNYFFVGDAVAVVFTVCAVVFLCVAWYRGTGERRWVVRPLGEVINH